MLLCNAMKSWKSTFLRKYFSCNKQTAPKVFIQEYFWESTSMITRKSIPECIGFRRAGLAARYEGLSKKHANPSSTVSSSSQVEEDGLARLTPFSPRWDVLPNWTQPLGCIVLLFSGLSTCSWVFLLLLMTIRRHLPFRLLMEQDVILWGMYLNNITRKHPRWLVQLWYMFKVAFNSSFKSMYLWPDFRYSDRCHTGLLICSL